VEIQPEKRIKVKAMCFFLHDGKILLQSGASLKIVRDVRPIVHGDFYRPLGGSIEVGEQSEEGIRREIREELGSEIDNLEMLEVIENVFVYGNEQNHEIVFLFKGDLQKKEIYDQQVIHIVEPDYEFDAMWVPIERILKGEVLLVPKTNWGKYLNIRK
jgi:8-oxo-dGTP pyrophosphatase MutT (NUDIX family)